MAYKKSYTRRPATKSYKTGKSFASYAGKSALTFAKAVAGSAIAGEILKKALGLNTEKHWLDTVETNIGINSSAGALANPLVIPQGDSVNARQGASCRLDSYTCKLRIQANAAATTPNMVRIMFVKFKDTRGTTPSSADFLDAPGRITSQLNMGDNTGSVGYTVLFDRTIPINVYTSDDSTKVITFRYNPRSHHLKWTAADTTGALSSLNDGFIRGYIWTSETGANTPNYWADHRIRFVDN